MKIKKIKINDCFIDNFTVFIYFIIHLLNIYTGSGIFSFLGFFVFPVFFYTGIERNFNSIFTVLSLFFIICIMWITNCRNDNLFYGCFLPFQYFSVTYLIVQKKISKNVFLCLLIIYLSLFFKKISTLTTLGDQNSILASGSRNVVSAECLHLTFLYYFLVIKESKKVYVTPAILTMVLCFLLYGRSGIIVSIGIFVLVLIRSYYTRTKRRNILFTFLLIIVLFVLLRKMDFDFDLFSRFKSHGIHDSSRELMISQYLEATNKYDNLFFGIHIKDYPIYRQFDGNMHNSFLTLHAYYGLFGFIIVISLILLSIFISLFNRSFFLEALLFLALLRVYVDAMAFSGIFDIFIYTIIFYQITHIKKTIFVSSDNKITLNGNNENEKTCYLCSK